MGPHAYCIFNLINTVGLLRYPVTNSHVRVAQTLGNIGRDKYKVYSLCKMQQILIYTNGFWQQFLINDFRQALIQKMEFPPGRLRYMKVNKKAEVETSARFNPYPMKTDSLLPIIVPFYCF